MQALVAADGTRANDFGEIRQIRHKQFAAIDSAEEVPLEQVLVAVHETQDCVRGTFELDVVSHLLSPSWNNLFVTRISIVEPGRMGFPMKCLRRLLGSCLGFMGRCT